jgi:uncharacterized NAD-dependent epimerase/dehydratase family protein
MDINNYEIGKKRKIVVIGVRFTIEEREQLERIAEEEGVSMSDIVRRVIKQYLKQKYMKAVY